MDQIKVTQIVEALNALTTRDALCLLVGRMLTILDEASGDENAGNRWVAASIC